MSDPIKELQDKLIKFREDRDWKQFHNPKDVALSLVLEAAEVLEHFQWKNAAEIEQYIEEHRGDIAEEIADVFNWVLILSHDLGIDLVEATKKKIEKNGQKYPVEKAKGKAVKYDRL
jgi:NTP pyrophosphatase (non-canonical NTP hydrolase)